MRSSACGGRVLLVAVLLAGPAHAQPASASATGDSLRLARLYPELRRGREVALLGAGGALLLGSSFLDVQVRQIPVQGLDPGEISWSVDRDVIGNLSVDADDLSDWTRTAAIVLPFAVAWFAEPAGHKWSGFGRRSVVYIETYLFSQGLTHLTKNSIGRARPYAYLPESQLPMDASYDAGSKRTFYSMPSGHSSSAWTGAGLAMTEHLLSRPEALWWERSGVGFLAGALAGSTSALRVAAGQHFPTDVLVGAGIGVASGITLPLLHHGEQPLPGRRAWLQMSAGVVAGTLCGMLVGQSF